VTLPVAKRVGAAGGVVALDIQTEMLHRVEQKLMAEHVTNVRLLHAGIGAGMTEAGAFDRAILVTVLGEIPNKVSALCEIWRALRPGGVLSITEVFLDPHLQTPATIRRLAHQTGFEVKAMIGRFPAFTINLVKPLDSGDEAQGNCG
jgi:ubiquinone/menaquinone biosynthesis C-methylase UbiE